MGSADPIGTHAYYDEPCSGKMAVTFSHSSTSYSQLVSTVYTLPFNFSVYFNLVDYLTLAR